MKDMSTGNGPVSVTGRWGDRAANDQPVFATRDSAVSGARSLTLRIRSVEARLAKCLRSGGATHQLVVTRSGDNLLNAYLAVTWMQRLKGLFTYPRLGISQALMLSPCSAVHTIGFSYAIDVAFVDINGRILRCVTMKPWSIATCRRACQVLEMAAGTADRLQLKAGQQLDFKAGSS